MRLSAEDAMCGGGHGARRSPEAEAEAQEKRDANNTDAATKGTDDTPEDKNGAEDSEEKWRDEDFYLKVY